MGSQRVGHNLATKPQKQQSINNVVIVSGAQYSDSAVHIHVSFVFSPPIQAAHNIEQSSLCYTVGPHWSSALNTAVCACDPEFPDHPFPHPSLRIYFLLLSFCSSWKLISCS